MTTSRHDSDLDELVLDYLVEPDDLKEIMGDLRGEELSLEELVQVLLDGGIELEYLSTKYKTTKGEQSLLMVIACQDSLEVDWEDLTRRCEEVILAVVGNHLCNEEAMDEIRGSPTSLIDLVDEARTVEFAETNMTEMEFVLFQSKLDWADRVICQSGQVKLLSGGIAPKWEGPQCGPALNRVERVISNPDLGNRPGSDPLDRPPLQKQARELLFPPKGGKEGPQAVPLRLYSRVVKEDYDKIHSLLSEWSLNKFSSIVQGENQNPLAHVALREHRLAQEGRPSKDKMPGG